MKVIVKPNKINQIRFIILSKLLSRQNKLEFLPCFVLINKISQDQDSPSPCQSLLDCYLTLIYNLLRLIT